MSMQISATLKAFALGGVPCAAGPSNSQSIANGDFESGSLNR